MKAEPLPGLFTVRQVLAQASALQDQTITVQGVLHLEFERIELMDHVGSADTELRLWQPQLWLVPRREHWLPLDLNGHLVQITGILEVATAPPPWGCGHMGLWPAEIYIDKREDIVLLTQQDE